ncbi:MAG: hypothetical protein MJE63_08200 [Proteobacteria bacterium]|nr:hypothetical protein [Pseudomonadota bacterium]
MVETLQQRHKIIISVHFISTIALLLFWGGYYLTRFTGWMQPAIYSGLRNAFPMPDSILIILMIAAGVLTYQKNKLGDRLSIFTALILVLIGIAGFHVTLSGGLQLISMVTVLRSGFVNLWCIVFGLFFLLKLTERKGKKRGRI